MLQHILGVAGSKFKSPNGFDQLIMNAMHTQVKCSLLTGFFYGNVDFLFLWQGHVKALVAMIKGAWPGEVTGRRAAEQGRVAPRHCGALLLPG